MRQAVFSQAEWLKARRVLLAMEKVFTKARDQPSAARRALALGEGANRTMCSMARTVRNL